MAVDIPFPRRSTAHSITILTFDRKSEEVRGGHIVFKMKYDIKSRDFCNSFTICQVVFYAEILDPLYLNGFNFPLY